MIINMDISEIVEGMTLVDDVINKKTGEILVHRKSNITRQILIYLKEKGVNKVIVKTNGLTNSLYTDVENNLLSIFDCINKGNKLCTENIIVIMEKLVKEITRTNELYNKTTLINTGDYTLKHSIGVSVLSILLAKWLNYCPGDILSISLAGLLHDIGKLKVSEKILNKVGILTEEERLEINKHSFYSYKILEETGKFNNDILLGVLQHHERMDGSGYPNGVKGERIHEFAKVIALCDIYDALSSKRVYREKVLPLNTVEYLRGESFETLDPYITQVFLTNIAQTYLGKTVEMSNGEIGTIVYIHPNEKIEPLVKVGNKYIDFKIEKDIFIVNILT